MNGRRMTLISQIYLIVLAVVLAIIPKYYLLVFIAYFAIFIAVSMYTSRRSMRGTAVPREEVEAARKLFAERSALEIASADDELIKMYAKQAKATLLSFAFLPVYWGIFEVARRLRPSFESMLSAYSIPSQVADFILWLTAFESMFAIGFAARKLVGRGQQAQPPLVPSSYIVTEKGIIVKGGIGTVIGFPLPEDSRITIDEKKGFVEITFGKNARIRLYTRNPRRLYEIIRRFGTRREKQTG